jgi:hypothetical protein
MMLSFRRKLDILPNNYQLTISPFENFDVFIHPHSILNGRLRMRDADATGLRTAVNLEPEQRRPHPSVTPQPIEVPRGRRRRTARQF